MRILLLNQFFWPDSAATSQFLTDLAMGLKERGHDVHVICVDGGYAIQDASASDPGVTVYRVKAAPFVRGTAGRALSYISFLLSCCLRGLFAKRPDLVITLTTPPLLSLIGTAIKSMRGTKHFIWEMDVYPDVAVDLNYIRPGGFLDKVTGALVDFSRRKADGILALGKCMRQRLIARGISGGKIHVADNWADGRQIRPVSHHSSPNSLTLLYSGNLGLAHDVDTVSSAMEQLKGDSRFRFIFAGGGSLRGGLEDMCRMSGIVSAEFRSYSQRQDLSESLGACDLGLITQRQSCLGSVVPSKVYGLLAAGRPIIFIGPAGSTVADIVKRAQCGWHIDNGDAASLVDLLKTLVNQPAHVEAAGKRARKAFDQHYDLPIGVERICSLVGASRKPRVPSVSPAGLPAMSKLLANRGDR